MADHDSALRADGRFSTVPRVFRPSRLLSIFVIMLGTFVAYWPAMRNSFVWDDTALILRDPLIRSWRLAPEAFREFLFLDATASNFYRPLQRLTYTADYALWGIARSEGSTTAAKTGAPETDDSADVRAIQDEPQPGWHFTSILAHGLAALALWWLLSGWFDPRNAGWALAGALAWALHPLHTSAVTYVSGRADSLAAFFTFTGLGLVARAYAHGSFERINRSAARALIIAGICALGALLSKESGVALLLLWPLWIVARAPRDRRSWAIWLCAAVIASGAYFALRTTAARTPPPVSAKITAVVDRPVLVARALAEYAFLFVAPHSQHMERDISTRLGISTETLRLRTAQTVAGLALAIFLGWWCWRVRKIAPNASLALGCAAVTWLPVSNVFRLNATVAEHWLYVPIAFLIAAILFTTLPFIAEKSRWFPVLRIAGVLWMAFLAVQTWRQHGYWRNQKTFVSETIERGGRGARMVSNLGQLAMMEGKSEEATALFRESLAIDPTLSLAHFNLATVAIQRRDFDTAVAELNEAERSPLLAPEIDVLRAIIDHARTGKPRLDLLGNAASSAGRNWSVSRRYPLALLQSDRARKAYEDVLRQLTGHPYRAEAWRMLGKIAESLSEPEIALRAYSEAALRDVRDDFSRGRIQSLRPAL